MKLIGQVPDFISVLDFSLKALLKMPQCCCLLGDQDGEERWAEVQKKMTPWRLGIQEQEPELGLVPQQRAARLGKLHSALLVVASLIDKPTNLGG